MLPQMLALLTESVRNEICLLSARVQCFDAHS
eukprot:SAG25_NODE_9200_length_383_cov_0.556338_1_plen_31_part_10